MSAAVDLPASGGAVSGPGSANDSGAGGGGGQGGSDWSGLVASLPEELRGANAFKEAKSFEDFAKQHVNLEKMLGQRKFATPDDKWTEKEWGEAYDSLGHPKAADAYKFEGLDLKGAPPTMLDAFKPIFAKHRLSERQARGVIDDYLAYSQKWQSEQMQAQARQAEEALPKLMEQHYAEYGGKDGFEKARTYAQAGAEALFEGDLDLFRSAMLPGGIALLDHPRLFNLLVEAGRSLDEGSLASGGGAGAGGDASEAALNALNADPEKVKALNDPQHPQHKEVVAERQRLQQAVSANRRKADPMRGLFGPRI